METSLGRSEALISKKTYSVLGWAARCHLENHIEFQHRLFVCFNFSCLKMGMCNQSICVAPWLVLFPRQGRAWLVPGSEGTPGALPSRSWAGWGDRPWNGLDGAPSPPQLKAFPYNSRGIVSRCWHSWKQSGFVWHITVLLITPCTPYLPRGTTWEFLSCSASSWRNCTNQRHSVSRSQQWGHQEKVWEGPAGSWGEAD